VDLDVTVQYRSELFYAFSLCRAVMPRRLLVAVCLRWVPRP